MFKFAPLKNLSNSLTPIVPLPSLSRCWNALRMLPNLTWTCCSAAALRASASFLRIATASLIALSSSSSVRSSFFSTAAMDSSFPGITGPVFLPLPVDGLNPG